MAGPDLRFYFDPVCPFAWMASKWVRIVQRQRDYDVDWRFISLRLLNAHIDYDAHFPPEYEAGHTPRGCGCCGSPRASGTSAGANRSGPSTRCWGRRPSSVSPCPAAWQRPPTTASTTWRPGR
ncbi:mycothiol-dependent nitroreductase Rv2466c family protein [Amycolatopsis deserti]